MQLFKGYKAGDKTTFHGALKRVIALAVMIVVTVSSVLTVNAATCNAVVNYNGETKTVQLFSDDTNDILNAAGINPGASDLIIHKVVNGETQITVKSVYDIKVLADGKSVFVKANYGDTVSEVIEKANVKLGKNDYSVPPATGIVTDASDIQVKRKFNISVTADGKTTSALVTEGSAENAVKEAGVNLAKEDIVNVQRNMNVSEGLNISVSRVTFDEVTETQKIPYTNRNEKTSSLYAGQTKVKSAGKDGSQTVKFRRKLVDGKAADTEVLDKKVITQPVEQVTLVGTKKKPSGLAVNNGNGTFTDQNGKTVSYKKVITGRSSCYTGGGTTSTGRPAAFGLVAVNPNIIPYGTKLYICSPDGKYVYGYAIAADTGGGVMKGRIVADLYYDSYAQCKNFGVRTMNIYVL